MLILLVILVVVCILVCGFFNGAETALLSVDKPLLHAQAEKGDYPAHLAERLLAVPARLLATILVGVNLTHVIATSLATLAVSMVVPEGWHSVVTTAIMTPVLLLFSDLLPKSIGRGNPCWYARATARGLYYAQLLLGPVVVATSAASTGVLRLFGVRERVHGLSVTREEVQAMADISVEQGVIGKPEYKMIRRVFDLNRTTLGSAMVPLVELECVQAAATLDDVLAVARTTRHTRLPVCEGRADNIIGMVHIANVLDAMARHVGLATWTTLRDMVDRDIPFMPETKTVGSMLHELQDQPVPFVFVVNEYGGVVGMISIQNLAEEVAGDWARERPGMPPAITEHQGLVECDGRVDVDVIGDKFGEIFDKAGYDTVAGLVLKLAGRVPKPGDTFTSHGLVFTILRATPKRVVSVSIARKA